MNLKKFKVEKFKKLPDKHGVKYDSIEQFKPKSYIKLENTIRVFLDYSNMTETDPPISAEMLVAQWGLGKTTTYEVMIKDLLQNENFNGFSVKITAQEISYMYDTVKNDEEYKYHTNNADKFLYILSKLIIKKGEFKKKFPKINDEFRNDERIINLLNTIKQEFSFFLIFVDELEEILKNENNIIVFLLKALKDLLNGTSDIINEETNPELIHFLSFIIACTDAAFYEIGRHEKLEYEYGGITRRISAKHLTGLTIDESIEYLTKLNIYSFGGKFKRSFVNPGASFKTIVKMAMKNPGYLKSFFSELLGASNNPDAEENNQIDGQFLLDRAKDFSLEYMEAQRKAINDEVYLNWFRKFKTNKIMTILLQLFIGELKLFSLNEINERIDEEVSRDEILRNIREFNRYITSIHSNIKKAIIKVQLFKQDKTAADIENILRNTENPVEVNDNGEQIIRFSETDILFEKFLDQISYYEIDNEGNINDIYYFSNDNEVIQQLFPYLESETVNILRFHFEKNLKLTPETDYYILNPNLFDIIFPLPIPPDYNILINKNLNVTYWTESSLTKKSDVFNKSICEILANLLIRENYLLEHKESKQYTVSDFEYFEKEHDKNHFVILKNYLNKDLSHNPINIMFWRELGDYNESIIHEIVSIISLYQKNESKNIHLIVLISQSRISEDLMKNLSTSIKFTILQNFHLSQFDITKYVFLERIRILNEDDFFQDRFDSALKNLLEPFQKVIEDSRKSIEEKGLNIKLDVYMEPLSNIPQLLKFILYDFKNDYNKWDSVDKFEKPFEDINPIGLNASFSSSIDEWGQEKLRKNIKQYLIENRFIEISNNHLKISMPKIQKNILELLEDFEKKRVLLTPVEVKNFFIETSDHPDLLNKTFLTDLKNRGLTIVKDGYLNINQIDEQEQDNILKKFESEIKLLRNDRNLYHIFSFKKRGHSLLFLDDFVSKLKLLKDLNVNADVNDHFLYTRQRLFKKISNLLNNIIKTVFKPLDVALSNFKPNLIKDQKNKYKVDPINSDLLKLGYQDTELENYREIKDLNLLITDIINTLDTPIKRKDLRDKAKNYHEAHKNEVDDAAQVFSLNRIKKNRFKGDFASPYLNLVFFDILEKKKQYFDSKIFKKLNKIKNLIQKINDNFAQLQREIIIGDYKGQIALKIKEKIESFSDFNFFETNREADNLDELIESLNKLNSEINQKMIQFYYIIRRTREKNKQSMLDRIDIAEILIKSHKFEIEQNIKLLKQKGIIENEGEIEGYIKAQEKLDFSEYIKQIEICDNLVDLQTHASNVFIKLNSETRDLSNIINIIINHTIKHFQSLRNIDSIMKIFEKLRMRGYVSSCNSFKNNLNMLIKGSFKIPFQEIVSHLISHKKRIDEGYEKVLNQKLNKNEQEIFLDLLEKFDKKDYFTENELVNSIEKFGNSKEDIQEFIESLIDKELLERGYKFK